jgi:acyl-CoA synthetase (AMP-forming)/AMP-acid ligase II
MNAKGSLTLADILLSRADGREALIFQRGDMTLERVNGAELLDRAQRAAATLRGNGVQPGDHVLLMLTAQSDFIDVFLGAIWADAVPVPLFPPIFSTRPEDFVANFAEIAATSGAHVLIASEDIVSKMAGFTERLGGNFRILSHSSANFSDERLDKEPTRELTDLALLQFTSGSTGTPKGVALSHANVLANVQAIGRAVQINADDTGVSWLPLYHDMGLISLLTTLYWGGRVVVLSPLDFARDPGIWLRSISEHGGTLSPAPNFAFRRCLRIADEDLAGLDLSTWRVAFNGAEPVDPDTVNQFTRRFAAYGFRRSTLYPVYGLAEHTLAVSFPSLGQGPRFDTVNRNHLASSGVAGTVPTDHPDAVSFVSVGKPLEGVSVEIHDEQGLLLPEGQVGEILVKSASVMTGYFENETATEDAISDGWLKTGDLGYLKDGMLYITGRIKDLIIRAGRNYYPTDIESAATGVSGVRAGRAAAFSVSGDTGEGDVVLLAESSVSDKKQRTKLIRDIATAVTARVGFRPERVVLYARGTLPITSSGKVRRRVARARFMNGEFDLQTATALVHSHRSFSTVA